MRRMPPTARSGAASAGAAALPPAPRPTAEVPTVSARQLAADPRHVILSLGAGVQSTTLALMAARGEIERPEAAIFADTGWEPRAVYEHLAWLIAKLDGSLPVHVVRKQHRDGAPANIRDDVLAVVRGARARAATPPVYVKQSVEFNPSPIPEVQWRIDAASPSRPVWDARTTATPTGAR